MSPNKRRMITSDSSDEDDSCKHRRSSLRVNLSYTNLLDSGNASLENMEAENNKNGTDRSWINRRLSNNKRQSSSDKTSKTTSKKNKHVESNDSETYLQIKKNIPLKHLTINLERINTKVQTLDINCKRLKDAILSKTKELFDKQDELSVKTVMVLANQEDCMNNTPNSSANKLSNQHFENKESILCDQHTHNPNNQQKSDEHSSIDATPKNSEKQRNLDKVVNRSKLTPKRLFTGERNKPEIREDVILLDRRVSLFPSKQVDRSDSPILSGSNRRLQLIRSRSKIFSHNQYENPNNTHLSAYSDCSINIGQPVTCSTFIKDDIGDKEKNQISYDKMKKNQHGDVNIPQSTHTINTLISMEMTEIHGVQVGEKHSSLLNEDLCNNVVHTEKENYNNISIEENNAKSAQRLENIGNSCKKLSLLTSSTHSNIVNSPDATDACVCTAIIPMQLESIENIEVATERCNALQVAEKSNEIVRQNKRQYTLNLSGSNSIRSSLNVNTSLDAVTDISKEKNPNKPENYGTMVTDQFLKITSNKKKSISLDNERESINSNRTSLQMNTSVDSICKTWQRKSNTHEQSLMEKKNNKHSMDSSNINDQHSLMDKYAETNDIDLLENISLIERLRNISARNQIPCNNKLELPEMENKERADVKSNGIKSVKFQSDDCANNNSKDNHSYVEGTPYPVSRSVLFKMQLKHKVQNLNNSTASYSSDSNLINNGENSSRTKSNDLYSTSVSSETRGSTETSEKIKNDTVNLEDTLNHDPFLTQEKTTILEDSLSKTEVKAKEENILDTLLNTEHVTTRRGKRKLLPLQQSSQYSIKQLAIEENSDTSEKFVSVKRNKKKLKRKHPKKIPEDPKNRKNNSNHIEDNITSKQVSLDDDCDMFENNKKENKKTRKPKKIVSKKIVIKKFVKDDMLNIIEDENRKNKRNLSTENRNSTDDFVANRMISTQWNKHKSQKIIIVTTGLSKEDKNLVKNIVKSLGMAEMELNVSRRTTHVVSTGVRTVNLLHGIIRGCWLVTLEWVLKSLESNVWLNPEEFEMKHFSKAVMENRKDRQLFGPSYIPELFTACGLIHVEHKTTMPYNTLKELIKTAGGYITENFKFAKIIIGENGLKETWVIDSITTGELQSMKLYQRK